MRLHLALLLLFFTVAACAGANTPTPAATTPPKSPSASELPGPTTTAVATKASAVDATELREEQTRRAAARVPLAMAVVDAYPNWNGIFTSLVADWSPDGKHIVFGSLRDGAPQIYLGDPAKPASAPLALTTGPERALWAHFTMDGTGVLFTRDTRGDENRHIFRVDADGTGTTDLTPGEPLRRGEPMLPRGKPNLMLYTASRNTEPSTTVFTQSTVSGEPRPVYVDPLPGDLVDVTADGSRALFAAWRSADDAVLSEIDVASGKAKRLYPSDEKKATVFTAGYSPDGKFVYVATDEGAESSVILVIDLSTSREIARYVNDSPKVAPMNAVVSPKGDRIAVQIDAGNHGEVRILDAKSMKLEHRVKVPLGRVQMGQYRADGKAFSIMISVPERPGDIYSVDAVTGNVKPLRNDERKGLSSLPRVTVSIETIKAFDGLMIPINQYLSDIDRSSSKKLPTIVSFHGGPAFSSAVSWTPLARFFTALGYAVLEPNVRGSTGFGRAYEMADNREKRADWLKDLETVNAWVKRQPWCDPDRAVVMGGSYGGYTTLMAVTRQPSLWRAGVDLYGIADLRTFMRTTNATLRSAFVTEFGDLDRDGALLDEFSPLRDVDKIVAPLFVYAGQNDTRVPRSESDAIVRALRARKVPVEYMVAANEGHSVDHRETKIELYTRVARFLEDAMSGPP